MKIRIIVGTSDGKGLRYNSGDVVDVEDGTAKSWIGHGFAEPVEGERRTATAPTAPRTAAKKAAPSPRKPKARKATAAKKATPAKKSEPTPPAGEDEKKD
jgi:hypothetical protein